MSDEFAIAYGGALILAGLISWLRGSSLSLLFGLVFGAWTIYNATHPTRQNHVANLAIASVYGVLTLLSFLVRRSLFPALLIIGLSAFQIFRNYPYLK